MTTMAAVDLGAQSGRVAIGFFDGERLQVSEVHRFPNEPVRTHGRLQWDILRLYHETLDGLRAASATAIASVGVDSWAVDFGMLDRKGRLVQNPVHYRDARRASASEGVFARIPRRELYERTGIQVLPINTVFELAAMAAEDDDALVMADKLLLIPDLVHYWLCGAKVSEFTNATTTQCLDARTGAWADDLLERLDVPARMFPEIVPPATVLGPLAPDVAADTGLAGARVVAGGTHDTASAVAAVPLRRSSSAYVSAGTWSLVGVESREAAIDDATFVANVTNEGGVAGTFRILRNVAGLWLLHECRRAWALSGRHFEFAELVELSVSEPSLASLVDPDDLLFAAPGDMPKRIRDYCARTGQRAPDSPGAVTRCVLESLALGHARALEVLKEAVGATPEEVHVVGGGSRNEVLCRWTAAACGLPVLAGPVEATEVGNFIVQAIALGELSSLDEGREVVRRSFELRVYEPETSAEWREARGRFAELVSARHARPVSA